MYIATNNARSALAVSLTTSSLDLTVVTGEGDFFPAVSTPDYTYITLEDSDGNIEIVKVTERIGTQDTFTILRAQQGTLARNWGVGTIVECRLTAEIINKFVEHITDAVDAHPASSIEISAISGMLAENVQQAVQELNTNLVTTKTGFIGGHIDSLEDAHPAEAIVYVPEDDSTIVSTDVQGAISELEIDKFPTAGGKFTGAVDYKDPITVAAAAASTLADAAGNLIELTGSGEVNGFGVPAKNARMRKEIKFPAGVVLVHNDMLSVSHGATPSPIVYTPQVNKVSFVGDPATGDNYSITINSVSYQHTVVAGEGKDDIAQALIALVSGLIGPTFDSITYDHRRNIITFTGLSNGSTFSMAVSAKLSMASTPPTTTAAVAQITDLNFKPGYVAVSGDKFVVIVNGTKYTYTTTSAESQASIATNIISAISAVVGSGQPIFSAQYQAGNNRIRLTGQADGTLFKVSSAFLMPGSRDITTKVGDRAEVEFSAGAWSVIKYFRETGESLAGMTGEFFHYAGIDEPNYGLFCNGASVSSATYNALFKKLVKTATVTFALSSPGVVNWVGHPLDINSPVKFSSSGALPTGIAAGTTYYVIATGFTSDSFSISATVGGAAINFSGTQSGTHLGIYAPYGCATDLSSFNVPNVPAAYALVQEQSTFGVITAGEVISHAHSIRMYRSNGAGDIALPGKATDGDGLVIPSTEATGGAANKAAGLQTRIYIRF